MKKTSSTLPIRLLWLTLTGLLSAAPKPLPNPEKKHGSERHTPKLLEMLKRYGAHAQRAIPRLGKAVHYFEDEETDFPKDGSLKKAEMVREAIREIRKMKEKPKLVKLGL